MPFFMGHFQRPFIVLSLLVLRIPPALTTFVGLNRSLYGLKQAPRAWYSRFASHLLQLGFVEAKTDTSLFVYHRGDDMVYLLLYVDDVVLTTSSTPLLRRTIDAL